MYSVRGEAGVHRYNVVGHWFIWYMIGGGEWVGDLGEPCRDQLPTAVEAMTGRTAQRGRPVQLSPESIEVYRSGVGP